MDKNGEKDAGGGKDGQTVKCTENEVRDGQVVIGKDNQTVKCTDDGSKNGQTVTCIVKDENSRATVKSTDDDDKNGQKVSSTKDGNLIKTVHSNITLDDVCGCQNAKDHLKEGFILPARYPQLFTGKRFPWKGTLLFGAPGTGKTMIGRALAGQCPDLGFIHVAASDLISKYIGEPEKIVRHLFEKAGKLKENNVIFIDDFELLSDSRSENVKKARVEVIVQFYKHENVRLLVATNQPWEIDPFHRKRLEKRIYIPMPEKEARKQIIRKNLESVKHDMNDEDLDGLAEKLEGYTGSDIVCVVRDATMEPVREIQKATHFRKVYKDSPETADDDKDFQYQVGTADDPDSIAMTLDDVLVLESDQLFERPLHKDDMMKSLSRSKPSIDDEYLKKLNRFAEEYT